MGVSRWSYGLYGVWKKVKGHHLRMNIEYGNDEFLSHLQYTYNTLVFIPNYWNSFIHANRILRWFELALGLQVNFYKSYLIGINLEDEFVASKAGSIFYRWDSLPIKYLELLLGANLKRISTWKLVISRIRSRLGMWK